MKEKVSKEDLALIELGEVSEVTLGPPVGTQYEGTTVPLCVSTPC